MTAIERLDRAPVGWFAYDVFKATTGRKWDWGVLMVNVHPAELKELKDRHTLREAFVLIPGKHRLGKAAWDAAQDMLATRH